MTFEEILDQAIAMLQWAADRVGIATAGTVGAATGQRQGPSRLDLRGIGVGGIIIDEHYQY